MVERIQVQFWYWHLYTCVTARLRVLLVASETSSSSGNAAAIKAFANRLSTAAQGCLELQVTQEVGSRTDAIIIVWTSPSLPTESRIDWLVDQAARAQGGKTPYL